MKKGESSGAFMRRETVVPDNAIYAALAAIAGVIEEPYCCIGAVELKGLVSAFGRLARAVDAPVDYLWVDGKAVFSKDRSVVKEPVAGEPGEGLAKLGFAVRPLDAREASATREA